MGLSDALIFTFAALVDLAVLMLLRRYRRWQRQHPEERAGGLIMVLRQQRVL